MTTKQVLECLGITRPVLQRLIDKGQLTPLNAVPKGSLTLRPRRFLFRAADVYALAMPHLDAAPPLLLAEDDAPRYRAGE